MCVYIFNLFKFLEIIGLDKVPRYFYGLNYEKVKKLYFFIVFSLVILVCDPMSSAASPIMDEP